MSGGAPQKLLELYEMMPSLWLPDGSFLLTGVRVDGRTWRGLSHVDADGTNVRKLTTLRPGEEIHGSPLVLSGGRWIVFTIVKSSGFDAGIVPFEGGEHELLGLGTSPFFVDPDILLTYNPPNRRVDAIRVNPETGELLSEPRVALPNVERGVNGLGEYAVGADGTLVYVPADPSAATFQGHELVWFDGETEEPIGREDLGQWTQPRLSPDETRLLVRMTGTPDCSLWLFDLERGSKARLTIELDTHNPLWHPEGEHVLFSAEPEDGSPRP